MNFAKFLRTPFLTEHLRWLLLNILNLKKLQRQGDVTLVYLFKLCLEILFTLIKIEKTKGKNFFENTFISDAYVDNITFFLRDRRQYD